MLNYKYSVFRWYNREKQKQNNERDSLAVSQGPIRILLECALAYKLINIKLSDVLSASGLKHTHTQTQEVRSQQRQMEEKLVVASLVLFSIQKHVVCYLIAYFA